MSKIIHIYFSEDLAGYDYLEERKGARGVIEVSNEDMKIIEDGFVAYEKAQDKLRELEDRWVRKEK